MQTDNRRLNERDLLALEGKIGTPLPTDYRAFLLSYNGGVPYHNTFDVVSGHDQKYLYSFAIRKFLGLNDRGHDDLIRTRYSLRHQLPEGFLPIAVDKFRNFMCLSLKTGQVYFLDLQSAIKSEWPKRNVPLEQFFYPVSHSFADLIDNLYHKSFS